MKYSFVKGLGPQTILELSKPQWCNLHLIISIVMAVALVLHLVLNAKWITSVGTAGKKWLALTVIALGIALAALLTFYPTKVDNSKTATPPVMQQLGR